MKQNRFLLIIFGFDMGLACIVISWYFIIQSVGWHDTRDGKYWAFTFLISYALDFLVINPVLVFLKSILINITIGSNFCLARLIKFFFIFFEENLFFR